MTAARKHGHARKNMESAEYKVWKGMKTRCYNQSDKHYKDYGGRGIFVCDRWKTNFKNFLEDMGDRPSSKHTIDRINNDKGYSKHNCRWATQREQALNRRQGARPRKLFYRGEAIVDLANRLKLTIGTIKWRIRNKKIVDFNGDLRTARKKMDGTVVRR